MSDNEIRDVRMCHLVHKLLVKDAPGFLNKNRMRERVGFIQEELQELKEAVKEDNLVEIIDALIDIVYVVKGTAVMMGLDWEAHWDEVQRANLAKSVSTDDLGRGPVSLVKPKGWVEPNHSAILHRSFAAFTYSKEDAYDY